MLGVPVLSSLRHASNISLLRTHANTPSGTKLRSHCMMMRTTAMLLLAFAFGRAGASKSQVCEDRRAPSAPR